MIKPTELRLGNYVNLNDGSEKDDFRQVIGVERKFIYTLIKGCRFAQVHQSFDRVYPIPLTEEILVKCGFRRNGSEYQCGDSTLDWYFSTGIGFIPKIYYSHTLDSCKVTGVYYLHQLQNLYFALTGKELEVKL